MRSCFKKSFFIIVMNKSIFENSNNMKKIVNEVMNDHIDGHL